MKLNKKVLTLIITISVIAVLTLMYFLFFNGSKKNSSNEAGRQPSGINNPYGLNGKVYFFAKQGSTTVIFPNDSRIKEITGKAVFVNPITNESFELVVEIPNGKKSAVVESPKIVKGKWQIKFSWSSDNKNYFSEHKIEVK